MAKKTLQASAEATAAVEENRALGREEQRVTLRDMGVARSIIDLWLEENEGDETPEIAELWAKLGEDTRQKVLRWGHYLRNREEAALVMQADEDLYRREADRLRERRLTYTKGTEKSRDALLFQMQEQGIAEESDEYITVKLQRNPPAVIGEVSDEILAGWMIREDIYNTFVRYTPEQFALDKNAIKAATTNQLIERLPEGLALESKQKVVIK